MNTLYNPDTPGFATRIQKAVAVHLKRYPQLQLRDLYKSFFQDNFGPGHLLASPEGAIRALEAELEAIESHGDYTLEVCGIGAQFCRLPLDLVLDEKVPKDAYIDCFLQSGSAFKLPSVSQLNHWWQAMVPLITSIAPSLKNFASDVTYIDHLLANGAYEVHHSDTYRNRYRPHYRIFSLALAKELRSEQ